MFEVSENNSFAIFPGLTPICRVGIPGTMTDEMRDMLQTLVSQYHTVSTDLDREGQVMHGLTEIIVMKEEIQRFWEEGVQ